MLGGTVCLNPVIQWPCPVRGADPDGNCPTFYRGQSANRCAGVAPSLLPPRALRREQGAPTFSAAPLPAWENLGAASKNCPPPDRPTEGHLAPLVGRGGRGGREGGGKHQLTEPVPRRVPPLPSLPLSSPSPVPCRPAADRLVT